MVLHTKYLFGTENRLYIWYCTLNYLHLMQRKHIHLVQKTRLLVQRNILDQTFQKIHVFTKP